MKKFAKISVALLLAIVMLFSMVACSTGTPTGSVSPSAASASPSTDSASAVPSASTAPVKYDNVTLNVVDWSDSTKPIRETLNKKFEAEHPGVKVNYTTMTQDQFRNTVLTAISAGNAPDVHPLPVGTPLSVAVAQNWFQPMDEYVSKDFKSTFNEGALNEGIQLYNGKMYVTTDQASQTTSLFFYNKKILADNNIDPSTLTTWTAFEEACKKITANGKGQYYGIIDGFKQTNRLEVMARSFAQLAGAKCNDERSIVAFNDDGSSVFTDPAMLSAVGFLAKLTADKVFSPDSASVSAPEARALFGQGKAAFIMQGAYCIPVWQKNNPDLQYGIMAPPAPDGGAKGNLGLSPSFGWMGVSSQCKYPELAAKYIEAVFSEEYQGACVANGGYSSCIKGVNEKYMKDPMQLEFMAVQNKAVRILPNSIIRNPNASDVLAEAKAMSPSFAQIIQGVLTGSVTDYKAALTTLAAATDKEWKRAISAVNDKGKKVSISDFMFPNWNTTKNYTAEDYKALK